jgi:acyl carrier protein
MRDLRAEVIAVIRKHLGVTEEQLVPQASFIRDLGADSLSLVELTLALEARFEIDIEAQDVARLRTVQDAVDYVAARIANSIIRG